MLPLLTIPVMPYWFTTIWCSDQWQTFHLQWGRSYPIWQVANQHIPFKKYI